MKPRLPRPRVLAQPFSTSLVALALPRKVLQLLPVALWVLAVAWEALLHRVLQPQPWLELLKGQERPPCELLKWVAKLHRPLLHRRVCAQAPVARKVQVEQRPNVQRLVPVGFPKPVLQASLMQWQV